MIQVKRIYAPPAPEDGYRVLVERLWPRGITKEKAAVDQWLKAVAPSTALRQWFGHDPAKWATFRARYWAELRDNQDALAQLQALPAKGHVTFVYAAKDEQHNSAVALKEFLEREVRRISHEP
ncbi:MAG: DUF488 domain-containing protein [Caldilinea sp. CFX5]|nr:DUF488 domain-containing protein [Caldilinea sp. CFX5]